jgi:alkylation response protein AidB-like acyl-CoA dehydrogenase
MTTDSNDYDALAAHFRPVFDRIAEGAAHRDHHRILAHEPIAWLRATRFGALRVPREHGGFGASAEQFFELLMELAAADSNIPQALRSHFGFVERIQVEIDAAHRPAWLRRVAAGAIFGNATMERGENALGEMSTTLTRTDDGWHLNGEKFYSTGSLYADWLQVAARRNEAVPANHQSFAIIAADAPGVELVDDWTGFGQRSSASGTTRFHDVLVLNDQVFSYARNAATPMTAVYQTIHLATLAGIARAILRDVVTFVRRRKRVYSHGAGSSAADDPLVQQVVGQLSAAAFTSTALVRAVAARLGEADRARVRDGAASDALLQQLELETSQAQIAVADAVLGAATKLFDVGGASALLEDLRLDRHWRNARTLASHNPAIYKARLVGDNAINETPPSFYWAVGTKKAAGASA